MAGLRTPRPPHTATEPAHASPAAAPELRARVRHRLFSEAESQPQQIGRFEVTGTLGAGGMGVVFEARDPSLSREVAIKVLDVGGRESKARFIREARAMARLTHEHVVSIYEVGEDRGRPYIAMELVRGQTLRRWLQTPRSVAEVCSVMRQAGEGLAAAHRAGLVHRDFKPDNVLVGDDGRVRVADFGLAKEPSIEDSVAAQTERKHAGGGEAGVSAPLVDVTQAGSILGTPGYMAPEQLAGEPANARTDQFAFCVALYEALYGQRAFPGTGLLDSVESILAGHVQPPPPGTDVPHRLHTALMRGLAPRRRRRHASMKPLLQALDRVIAQAQRELQDTAPTGRRGFALLSLITTLAASVGSMLVIQAAAPPELQPRPTDVY